MGYNITTSSICRMKMQIIQRAIVKASTVLVNTVNKMAATDENNNAIDECNDALVIQTEK